MDRLKRHEYQAVERAKWDAMLEQDFRDVPAGSARGRDLLVDPRSARNESGLVEGGVRDALISGIEDVVGGFSDRGAVLMHRAQPELDRFAVLSESQGKRMNELLGEMAAVRTVTQLNPWLTGTCAQLLGDESGDQLAQRMRLKIVRTTFRETLAAHAEVYGGQSVVAWTIHWDLKHPQLVVWLMPQMNYTDQWWGIPVLSHASRMHQLLGDRLAGLGGFEALDEPMVGHSMMLHPQQTLR